MPKTLQNDMMRHIASPAYHSTVAAIAISVGTKTKVTKRSAMAKCISIASIREGARRRFLISTVSTFMLPMEEKTNRMLAREGDGF